MLLCLTFFVPYFANSFDSTDLKQETAGNIESQCNHMKQEVNNKFEFRSIGISFSKIFTQFSLDVIF